MLRKYNTFSMVVAIADILVRPHQKTAVEKVSK